MRLSDVMSSMQLSSYAEVALLLFLGAFVAVSVSVFRSRHSQDWERFRHLPLDAREDTPTAGAAAHTKTSSRGAPTP